MNSALANRQKSEPIISKQPTLLHMASYDIIKVWKTIQGEGPFAGWPATFVRLAGCNLQCPWCDTQYTQGRTAVTQRMLEEMIVEHNTELVVFTGGEPFRQDLYPILVALLACGKVVQIETNGTIFREELDTLYSHPNFHIVCSPKDKEIHPKLQPHLAAVKYILQAGYVAEDGLPQATMGFNRPVARLKPELKARCDIYVQPLDEQNSNSNLDNLNACVQSCLKFNYRLSIQLHKLCGVE